MNLDAIPLEAILKGLGQTGVGGVLFGVLFGLAAVIKAWRGTVTETSLSARVAALEGKVIGLEADLERVKKNYHDMRWQRDKARLRVYALEMKHGEPITEWEADKEDT